MNFHSALRRILVLSLVIFVSYVAARAQVDSIYRLPVGTHITLKLDAEISSKFSGLNDTFLASVSQPLMIRNTVVLAVGTVIEGRVTGVKPAAAPGKSGKLDLAFETLRISSEESRTIDGVLVNELRPKRDFIGILAVVGGTAGGAIFGGLARSGNGALIGAGIGAAVGTGIALNRKGKEAYIDRDSEFEILLRKEVVLPVVDY